MKNIIIKMIFMIFAIVLNGYGSFGQGHDCSMVVTKEMVKKIIEDRKNRSSSMLKSSNPLFNTAVHAYIVKNNDGDMSGHAFTEDDVETEISRLNQNFAPADMTFTLCNTFTLNNTEYYDGVDEHTLEYLSLINEPSNLNVINIIFTPLINDETLGAFEWGTKTILISTTHKNNTTLTHEMGHRFGLLHTFESGNGFELVSRTQAGCTNCQTAGDGFCDTDADRGSNQGNSCGASVIPTYICSGGPQVFTPPFTNYMSYYICRNEFSGEQIEAMRWERENGDADLSVGPGTTAVRFLRSSCPGESEPPPNCNDDIRNQGEEIVDCGGPCPPCESGSISDVNFDCASGCNNDLSLTCGALSGIVYNLTISLSNLQVTNSSNTTANNVSVKFLLIGQQTHLIGTYNVGSIAPLDIVSPSLPYYYIHTLPDGVYNLQAELIDGFGDQHSCISLEQVYIGVEPGGGKDFEFTSCGPVTVSEHGFYMPYKLYNIGSGTAPSSRFAAYLSEDAYLDDNDTYLKDGHVPSLDGGYHVSAGIQFTIDNSLLPDGDSYIILNADYEENVTETNEFNNTCVRQLNACESYSTRIVGNWTSDIEVTSHIIAPRYTSSLTNTLTIQAPEDVTFNAGKYIDFNPGFTAEHQSTFTAFIEGCDVPTVND